MTPWTFSLFWNAFSSLPQLSSRRALSRDSTASQRIFDAFEIDLDGVADLDLGVAARSGEFAQRHAAFGLQADVNDGQLLFDPHHRPFDDGAFLQVAVAERFFEQRGKIFARRRGGSSLSHEYSTPHGLNRSRTRGSHQHSRRLGFRPSGRDKALSGPHGRSGERAEPPMTKARQPRFRPVRAASMMATAARNAASIPK